MYDLLIQKPHLFFYKVDAFASFLSQTNIEPTNHITLYPTLKTSQPKQPKKVTELIKQIISDNRMS